ncbi:unnamed protein product [Rotaria socialis]
MTAVYYIKVYLTKINQQQEIRRFCIDISPENDVYNELTTKIKSYLSNNQLQDFILQYNDEDNERITFSSNDELRSAITLNKDTNTLKVFVTFNQSIPQEQHNATNKECHVGVECDACKGPVIGCRYKCCVCPNYDLCEKCALVGIHSEHNMIKISKPSNYHNFNDHYHHHFNNHHDGHQHNHMPPPHPPSSPFVSSQDYLQKIQAQIPQWLPNRQNAAHFRSHVQQHIDSLKANSQTHMKSSKQYLENVGQYLQKTLTPLGVNCEYHVEEEKQKPNEQQEEQVSTTTTTTTHSAVNSVVTSNSSDSDSSSTNNNNQENTENSIIPPVEESTHIRNSLEYSIDDCMQRMTAMGFIDANGALRELIRSKQGDINLVLDAINPRSYQV